MSDYFEIMKQITKEHVNLISLFESKRGLRGLILTELQDEELIQPSYEVKNVEPIE